MGRRAPKPYGGPFRFEEFGLVFVGTYPTERIRQRVTYQASAEAATLEPMGSTEALHEALADRLAARHMVAACVTSVEGGYEDGNGEPITDGSSLAEHGEELVVLKVARLISSGGTLPEGEKKDSGGSSESKPAETPPSDGTAEVVSPTDTSSPGA